MWTVLRRLMASLSHRPTQTPETSVSTRRSHVTPRSGLGARLAPGRRARLEALAELRGELLEETASQIAENVLRAVPASMGGYRGVDFHALDIAESGVDQGMPWLRTKSGRVFYEHPATAKDVLMYVMLRDRVPSGLTAETLVVASHVIRRYLRGADNLPSDARIAVDAGCYTGLKPIAYADRIGAAARVVAIEMMPDNFALLARNVEANELDDRVTPVHCALSDRAGTVMTRRLRKQQATIAENLDQLQSFGEECEVPMDTLANVFDRTVPGGEVDFLNVQVNGHELSVLEGLGHWKDRVGRFSVTSPYTTNGEALRDQVATWFADNGIAVTEVSETSVTAVKR
jgi:FkbM family methyltransferase